jgi:Na+-driven multidrug efflux pump
MGLHGFMFLLYFFGGFLIIRIFSSDALVIEYGIDYLHAVAVGWTMAFFADTYGAAFRGAGHNFPPMTAGILANWLLKLPLAFVCSGLILQVFSSLQGNDVLSAVNFGLSGIWWAITVSMLAEGAIMLLWFRTGSWKRKRI